MELRFEDRREAGRYLATKLQDYAGRPDLLVLGLPRGGVPVAFEVAKALRAPLDVFLVRKLGVPGHEELAMGAIATGGVRVLNEDVVRYLNLTEEDIEQVAEQERQELRRRQQAYRGDRPKPVLKDRTIILVDDGLATGATMRAAVQAIREQDSARIVIAVPTASPDTCADFKDQVEDIICAITPEPFLGVGLWYEHFSQTTDEEVRQLMEQAIQVEAIPDLPS